MYMNDNINRYCKAPASSLHVSDIQSADYSVTDKGTQCRLCAE